MHLDLLKRGLTRLPTSQSPHGACNIYRGYRGEGYQSLSGKSKQYKGKKCSKLLISSHAEKEGEIKVLERKFTASGLKESLEDVVKGYSPRAPSPKFEKNTR